MVVVLLDVVSFSFWFSWWWAQHNPFVDSCCFPRRARVTAICIFSTTAAPSTPVGRAPLHPSFVFVALHRCLSVMVGRNLDWILLSSCFPAAAAAESLDKLQAHYGPFARVSGVGYAFWLILALSLSLCVSCLCVGVCACLHAMRIVVS